MQHVLLSDADIETARRKRSTINYDLRGLTNSLCHYARTDEGRTKWARKLAELSAEIATDIERGIV